MSKAVKKFAKKVSNEKIATGKKCLKGCTDLPLALSLITVITCE